MDLACGFGQSTACCRPLTPGFRNGRRGCSILADSRVFRISSLKRRKERAVVRVACAGDFNGLFRCSRPQKFLSGDLLRSLRFSRSSLSLHCQGNDSLAFVDGSNHNVEIVGSSSGDGADKESDKGPTDSVEEEKDSPGLEDLREMFQKALKELEVARLNSTMFEEKAQRISEMAISLQDEAASTWDEVNSAVSRVQVIINEESVAKEALQKATMSLSMAEARLQLAIESLDSTRKEAASVETSKQNDEDEAVALAQEEIKECEICLANCEADLKKIQAKKMELQKEVDRVSEVAEKAQFNALKAEEEVANIMLLAEQAVAFEIEATQRVNDAEIALQRAEKAISSADIVDQQGPSQNLVISEEFVAKEEFSRGTGSDSISGRDEDALVGDDLLADDAFRPSAKGYVSSHDIHDQENGNINLDLHGEAETEIDKSVDGFQGKKLEAQQKDLTKDGSVPPNVPKALLKKSSRFFSASFFSFSEDGEEITYVSFFQALVAYLRKQAPKLVLGMMLLGMGTMFLNNKAEKYSQLVPQQDIITGIEEVTSTAKPMLREIRRFPRRLKKLIERLPQQEINEEEASLFDMLWLLLASVVFVPLFQKIPGGSPVLGYLAAGILIGPYGFSIIRHVHGTKAIAEFGVVFLLFNIGLELSVERLSSMKKYVFGLGTAQVLATATVVGLVAHFASGLPGPAAIVIGNGLALSSTAVVLQVLQERGESTSRHGRATFSVLLFQDLAVVVLLILIPLISPSSSKGGIGFQAIAEALGLAGVKAVVAITAIIAGGRLFLRPIYKQIAENQNAEIFSANTLLVILGTSLLTARAGLSMALGAFLAGLLLAETEFSLQVESDIAPYRGLLLGLFFMTVGMSIDPKLLLSNFPVIVGTLSLLIGGKTLLVSLLGRILGLSSTAAIRTGLLLAPGGEFAFVAFGEAVNQGIMSPQLSSLLFLVVGISMALTPWLAAGGQMIASRFDQQDVRSFMPVESETDDLQDHIILCGFGRVGQIIAQLLSERLIPFVALDVDCERVSQGRALDLPVYFGDAGNREVLHKVGAERACAAAITLDTPGASYRTVWALNKYFPNVKTFVRAHDVDHGLNLEKAGATAVVPETLEPSLQLAAAVLAQAKLPMSEITATINEFRTRHLSELTELCQISGSSLGYGYSRVMSKSKIHSDSEDNEIAEGTLAI
ncbi:Prefoldin domain-containing protein [Dioscorea alata]|uniref:Prefoldin domain-containing protein n=3 Tax=Dioscorea alata TaxID=55571 RepID=A0ACB7V7J5_DIOAL|nr:Prefoldin domain-containing protein [Dioscorea alata]KAH7669481.1 Prefoldin domain-containing protein [Dioscorea alata]KAH7669482.1 Prefoldin domain-containing protein [Dioscorea alata]